MSEIREYTNDLQDLAETDLPAADVAEALLIASKRETIA